jgi:hypothetical protein
MEREVGSVGLEGQTCDFPEAADFPFKLVGAPPTCKEKVLISIMKNFQ